MPEIEIPYHDTKLKATLPDDRQIDWLRPREVEAVPDQIQAVTDALDNALGLNFEDLAGREKVAIAINDKTRPVPHDRLLPPLLQKLESIGYAPEQITLIIATGTHPVMPPEEYPLILPELITMRYNVICHDYHADDDILEIGTTSRGTAVTINRFYHEADLRMVVGNVEPHQFMGFSGGVKSAVIGLAGKATINANHSMLRHEGAYQGKYEENPMRQDVEEMGEILGVDFALNTLMNGNKDIVEVFSGDPVAVMKAAIPRVLDIFTSPVDAPYDMMIVSPGGWPKDINIYQGQKSMGHASAVMKDGGQLILCAACSEGTGSKAYEEWVTQHHIDSYDSVFKHFENEGFRVGPHKAFQIARDASRFHMQIVTQMKPEFTKSLLMNPAASLQSAVDYALSQLPDDARIGILPYGNSTIPLLKGS